MFVAVWRYSTALSVVLAVGAVLAQPALAHGRFVDRGLARHHHHHGDMRAASAHFYNRHARRHRHGNVFVEAPAMPGWNGPNAPYLQASYGAAAPQDDWQHGRRVHGLQQNAWQQNAWQQTTWQQNAWQ